MTITTNVTAKVASVATGFAMALSMLAAAPLAHADQASDLQAQINSLMATIAALQSQLNTANGGSSMGGSSYSFTRDLTVGTKGADVTALQSLLISKGYSIPAGATGTFGPQTQAAVIAWQKAAGISPAAGYVGPKSRAALAGMGGGTVGVPGTPVTGNGLKVMLASDSPNNIALVQLQGAGDLAHFVFQNPTGSEIKVTNLTFNRIGVSTDSAISNVYLFDGAMRLTDPAGLSNSTFNFNDSNGVFTVPAGGSRTISVRADIANSTSGQQIGVQLSALTSSGALDSSVSLPVKGYTQTVSSASMAAVSFGTVSIPAGSSSLPPGTDTTVFQSTVTVSTRAVLLKSITLENRGSTVDDDFQNLKLYVKGNQVGATVSKTTGKKVVFDLSANPLRLETGGSDFRVAADIVGGSGDTVDFQVRRAVDAQFIDSNLMQPIVVTGDFSGTADTVEGVDLSITKASNSPSNSVAVDASNVKWASFQLRAIGDDLKVEQITVDADQDAGTVVGLDNGKVFLNGVQIGSTQDIPLAGVTFSFGSQMILKRGTTAIVDIYSDAKQADGTSITSGAQVDLGISVATADTEGVKSGDRLANAISEVEGNIITISSATLSASKVTSYPNQSVVSGTNNFKLGSFSLAAGSNEGVNINTIAIAFASAESSTLTNLRLVNSTTGAAIGTTKSSVSTTNTFSVSGITLAASGSMQIDVIADVKSGANIGAISATTVTTSTGGNGQTTGNSITVPNAAPLQTITVASSGTLTAAVNTGGLPADAIVVGGTSGVKIGSFNFLATNAGYTVNKVIVKVPSSSASAVSMITLKDATSGAVLKAQGFDLGSPGTLAYASSTFTGLGFVVPTGTSRAIDVYVDVVALDANNAALSGETISVLFDGDEGFEATDGAGNLDTTLTGSTADLSSDGTAVGTAIVRKSAPTITGNGFSSGTLAGGANATIGKFTIAANNTGDNGIDWGKVTFSLTKSASVQVGATTTILVYDITGGAHTNVPGTFATTTAGATVGLGTMEMFSTSATSGIIEFRPTTVQNVAKGSSKTYQIETTIGGTLVSGNALALALTNPSTSATTTSTFAASTAPIGTALSTSNPSFVWSDWSDVSDHFSSATGASTGDWTSDYLVKTLPITVGNLWMP